MTEESIEIHTADGPCDAVLYLEPGKPGVLFMTDAFGIRDATRGCAKRVAALGYTVLMPNLFYRTSRPPVFDFEPSFGEERTVKRFAELTAPITPAAMESDVAAYAASPHLLLSRINPAATRFYFGHAVEDRTMPADAIETLDAALKEWGGKYESEIYEGASHGWTVPGRVVYNESQAERAFRKLAAFLG